MENSLHLASTNRVIRIIIVVRVFIEVIIRVIRVTIMVIRVIIRLLEGAPCTSLGPILSSMLE